MPGVAPLDIHHEPAAHRFVARAAGVEAVLEYDTVDATTLDYHHTFVPPALRGGGIASQLTASGISVSGQLTLVGHHVSRRGVETGVC